MEYIFLVVGIFLLIKCADLFVDGCSNIAKFLGIPSLVIGLTIVAFGTSAPEAAVSITAALNGQNDISIGNVVGSNICNLLLVLGLSAIFNPLKVKKDIVFRDYMFSLLSYIILLFLVVDSFIENKGTSYITFSEGLILLCFLGVYLYTLLLGALKNKTSLAKKEKKEKFKLKDIIYIIIGLIGIILGGNLVVDGATTVAKNLNITENLIALTIVAIGTSLPELVTSVVAAKKGETDIAIGNVLGSNVFNIFFIVGISSTLSPLSLNIESLIDIIIMTIIGIIIFFFIIKDKKINKKSGIYMLMMYLAYMIYIILR